MLTKRTAFAVPALFLALIGDSLAQRSRTKSSTTPKTEQSTKPDQRGTPNQPLSVNVMPTPEQKAAIEKQDTEAKLKAIDDKKLVEYTGDQVLIGIVTFFIFLLQLVAFVAQACYMRRSYIEMRRTTHATIRSTRAAQKSADAATALAVAAKDSAEAAIAAERAYVFPGYTPLEFRDRQARFTLRMSNAGRMPAGIQEIGWKFLQRESLPPTRGGRDWQWETIKYDYIVPAGQTRDSRRFLSFSGNNIFVMYIKYQDLFTKKIHYSWMGMHIYPDNPEEERTDRAGGDEWNEWN